MTALNFFPRFADAIRNGDKRQTIRPRGQRNPIRAGDPLSLYTGALSGYLIKW